ncbi:MAG: L-rhamnose mutarotase [Silicimonas sp.]|nr:L-rhamnose mutarotase [Silicimonas sp.]
MTQHAWVLGVKPGYEDEYKRRHDELWPEMEDALRASGITSYTIFRHGLTLFGYFETDDLDATITALKTDPVNAKWSEYMGPIMDIDIDPATDFPFLLPKQWSLN